MSGALNRTSHWLVLMTGSVATYGCWSGWGSSPINYTRVEDPLSLAIHLNNLRSIKLGTTCLRLHAMRNTCQCWQMNRLTPQRQSTQWSKTTRSNQWKTNCRWNQSKTNCRWSQWNKMTRLIQWSGRYRVSPPIAMNSSGARHRDRPTTRHSRTDYHSTFRS
jgi:hypothetical protein